MMVRFVSPLRYPGGKTPLTAFLAESIRINGLVGGNYVEPFAGGAGAALHLLFSGLVERIYINDKDPCIYHFWKAVVEEPDRFVKLIWKRPLSVREWRRQREIVRHPIDHSTLEVGFATFYLNRCNHSGVLNGGPIGGLEQGGEYKINARFNKGELVRRIERIGLISTRINISNEDGVSFLRRLSSRIGIAEHRALVYMDPPYYKKGRRLYPFYFEDKDHETLAKFLQNEASFRWMLSCDNVARTRRLYTGKIRWVKQYYCVHSRKTRRELIFASSDCQMPSRVRRFYLPHEVLPVGPPR